MERFVHWSVCIPLVNLDHLPICVQQVQYATSFLLAFDIVSAMQSKVPSFLFFLQGRIEELPLPEGWWQTLPSADHQWVSRKFFIVSGSTGKVEFDSSSAPTHLQPAAKGQPILCPAPADVDAAKAVEAQARVPSARVQRPRADLLRRLPARAAGSGSGWLLLACI